MQKERIEKRLAEIQADPNTQKFQESALAQLDFLLNNPPLHGEIVGSTDGAEYQRISSDAKEILEKNGFISLLLAVANFITNVYRYLYFGYAQPNENEEEEVSRGKLRVALLAAVVENEYVVSEYFKLVFNTNHRYPEWKVFPDLETREEQIRSAYLVLEIWQALMFPEDMFLQDSVFSQGQQDFLQAQRWDMQEAGDMINKIKLPKINEPEIESRLQFLYWLVEHNRVLPKPDLSEVRMVYGEILAKALSKVGG